MVKKVILKRTPTGHRLSVNTDTIGDITRRYPPFIRWDRCGRVEGAGGFSGRLTVNSVNYAGTQVFDNGWYDADYELIDPLPALTTAYQVLVYALGSSLTQVSSLSGVNMKVTWTGGAAITSVSYGGDANNNTSTDLVGRSATFTFKATQSAPQGGFCTNNSWITFNLSGTEPPRNIRVFEAANEAALLAGDIFDPTWLAALQSYDVLRLMDFLHTNTSGAIDYTDIATDSFTVWSKGSAALASGVKAGPSAAAIAALANQALRPIWICIPHQFTDAAITTYATYLRDNVSASAGTIYVEYSNEVWNTGFSQTTYAQTQGALISAWSANTATVKGNKWAGLRAAQVCSIFRNVFGTNSGNRWAGVLATQLAGTSVFTNKLIGLDYFLDPANLMVQAGDTSATLFSHAAGAPYFGPAPSTVASGSGQTLKPYVDAADQAAFNAFMYSQITASAASNSAFLNIAFWRPFWQTLIAAAAGRGWTMVMYEGGNGSLSLNPLRDNLSGETDGTAFNLAFATYADSAEVGLLHTEMYRLYLADGGFKPNKFNVVGQHSKTGPWGARQNFADTNDCYTALSGFNAS